MDGWMDIYQYICVCVHSLQLAKRYGNVYSIFLGTRRAVVINGISALKEALVNKSSDFSNRGEDMFVRHAAHQKGRDLPKAPLSCL